MIRKILSGTVMALGLMAFSMGMVGAAGTTHQESEYPATLGGWYVEAASDYSGGSIRYADEANRTVRFSFSGTAITWVTRKSPVDGEAEVLIDGVSKGVVNLYASTPIYKHKLQYGNLSNGHHILVIKVLGAGNPASFYEVPVDAFIVGNTTTQDDSPSIVYNDWKNKKSSKASGGTVRISGKKGNWTMYSGSDTKISWVTATGPRYGKVQVFLNGSSKGVVDLYSPTQQWQVTKTYDDPFSKTGALYIKVLGEKNPASKGKKVVTDAFITGQ